METRELLRSHSSVRKYTGEQISKETVIDLIETAQMAASSHFVQAYSVIWVTDEDKKKKLGEKFIADIKAIPYPDKPGKRKSKGIIME